MGGPGSIPGRCNDAKVFLAKRLPSLQLAVKTVHLALRQSCRQTSTVSQVKYVQK